LRLFLLHPAVVHFPIALLLSGLVAQAGSRWSRGRALLGAAASWLLWIGVFALWAAVGTGLLAERTAPHVPPAWEVLHEHRELGLWTAGLFSVLGLGRILLKNRLLLLQLLLWVAGAGVLVSTAWHGGELVFQYGMGVVSE